MNLTLPRLVATGIVTICALGLAGCAPAPPGAIPSTAPSASATDPLHALCAESAVEECTEIPSGVIVTVVDSASEAEIVDLAERLHDVAADKSLDAEAVLQQAATDVPELDPEISVPPKWQLTVYPGEVSETQTPLRDILAVAAVPGTLNIVAIDGWPYVTVAYLDQFDEVFDAVSVLPLFTAGGTYTLMSPEERLRIVHVPTRTSNDAIHEIISVAKDFPESEVLLEAPTSGPQVPTFYVSRLTPDEVVQLDGRLRDPRLATADVDGYALSFVLGSLGAEGTTYTAGTFGNVAAE